jgi:hypothetical protein
VEFSTLRKCGQVGIEFSNIDTDGARVSRDFLKQLVSNIVWRSVKYYEETNDNAFYYRERQFHSIVCPSIADITYAYLLEHPLKRKPAGEDEARGFADYWISYRNYSFLMEMKHAYFSYNRVANPRRNVAKKFNDALEQFKNVRKEECRGLSIKCNDLIKIALETIVFYEGSKEKLRLTKTKHHNFAESFEQLIANSDFNQAPNMKALWVLNQKMVEPYEYEDGTSEIYPAVGFIGNISEGQTK